MPLVVLNACQAGMLDDAAETAFASVAASLLRAGTRSVVAMAYSLYVSAAQEFLPDFHRGWTERLRRWSERLAGETRGALDAAGTVRQGR